MNHPHYYNEWDEYAAQWLRNLINAGHLPAGDVDERSITDVAASDLTGYTQCHFFAGIGGWSLAARMAGWPDDRELWTGSCPCQPFSVAGKGEGQADKRHLWPEMFRLISSRRPDVVMGEQVAAAIKHGWLDKVFDDLEGGDYACGAVVVPACSVGANHRRDRLWWISTNTERHQQPRQESCQRQTGRVGRQQQPLAWDGGWETALRSLRVVDDGVQRCVEAADAARNAIVPQVAAEVIAAYMDCAP